MAQLHILFEHASGYSLFKTREFEEIGAFLPQVEASANDPSKFKKVVNLVAFMPFKNAASALENMNSVSEGILSKELSGFLQTNLPASGKKNKSTLGVGDPKLGSAISEALEVSVTHIGVVPEVIRGIRCHLTHFIKGLSDASMKQTELGLGHSYSRGKVKFNVHKVDNMIIQSIALVDQLDKDINTFAMRIREWYSYHFPELSKVIPDNYEYALCTNLIKNRNHINESEDMLEKLEEVTKDSSRAQAVIAAARMSMGMDISPIDLMNIEIFAKKVARLAEYRKKLSVYLRSKMNAVAPNLSTLIGEVVGARLISHAGSLTNLAKCPASTVQILGAEKALFRALKAKTDTPKYGLIYHSTFIGRASTANKGRISRYLANKCSIASRVDCFSDVPTSVFGECLKTQVEDRLKFYDSGKLPPKNAEVMASAMEENSQVVKQIEKIEKKKRKRQASESQSLLNGSFAENGTEESPKKKRKSKGKVEVEVDVNSSLHEANNSLLEESPKKKKKKKKKELDNSMNESVLENSQEIEMEETELMNISQSGEGGGESTKKKKKKRKSEVME